MIFAASLLLVNVILAQGNPPIIFDGNSVAAKALPETVPKPVRETAAKLEPWAEKHHIHVHVAAGDPIVLCVPASLSTAGAILTKLHQTKDDFTQRFESKIPDAALELVYVDKKEAFTAYIDGLAAREDYLKGWAAGGVKETAGFWLHRPIASAYFRDPKDPKEKKAEFSLSNQLIHQLGHLLVNAAYARQPYWVQESIAWSLEAARENQIYAFCHRSGFVAKKEHGGWPKLGKTYLLSTKGLPFDKIFPMERDQDIARELGAGAMVLTDFLVAKHKEDWTKCIVAFRSDIEAKAADPSYKISVEKQKELFNIAFGADAGVKLQSELK